MKKNPKSIMKNFKKGRIIKIISNQYTVLIDEERIKCQARGKFRNQKKVPMVGDIVLVSDENMIENIEKRKTELERPFISNVDQAVVVTSVKSPNLSLHLLDKLLVIIEYNNIKPVICFTKLDLLDEIDEIKKLIKYYQSIGYQVFSNQEQKIKKIFKNKITVFTGQTGAGKSSLLNLLDQTLKINTAPISKALGRGKHTTRHVELYLLMGGLIADTPGFSALSFSKMSKSDIRDNMIEFNQYRDKCKYRDCIHLYEDGCEIKRMVEQKKILESRYQNYLKFIREVK